MKLSWYFRQPWLRYPRRGGRVAVACCLVWLLCPGVGVTGVYDQQVPFSEQELVQFMELLPRFRQWVKTAKADVHPSVDAHKRADFSYDAQTARWVQERGWDPVRFFCVMGRSAAALALVEAGGTMKDPRPASMPEVAESEMLLVRRHLGSLLRAGQ